MALWKESTEKESFGEKNDRPEQELSPPSPIQNPIQSPVRQRTENSGKDRAESFFGAGVTIEGKIEGDGDVRMAGRFNGDINVKGDLKIDQGAQITGTINAGTVTIEGKLDGNIVASDQVKLLESAQMIGDLKAKTLTVAAGSRMRGNVEFGWDDLNTVKIETHKTREKGEKEPARANGSAV